MIKKVVFLFCVFLYSTMFFAQQPFDLEYVFPEDMYGWMGPANEQQLQKFIINIDPEKVVEVGTWMGLSAIYMAKRLKAGAKLYCVDPWVPYADMAMMPECQARMKDAYQRFLSNCIHNKVTDKIVPMRMPSLQAATYFSADIDLIYIDGSHKEEDVFNDILAWYPKLSSKGILCGDDLGWPSVRAAVLRALPVLKVTLKNVDNFWWLEKIH